MSGLTFRGWLGLQDHRDDAVGDLAREHARCRFTDAASFARHLVLGHDATGPDLAAFRAASKAYTARTRQKPGTTTVARRRAPSPVASDGPAGDTQPSDRSTRDR